MKNQFRRENFVEHTIEDDKGKKVGTIRVTPAAIKWQQADHDNFRGVSIDAFRDWIMENGNIQKK